MEGRVQGYMEGRGQGHMRGRGQGYMGGRGQGYTGGRGQGYMELSGQGYMGSRVRYTWEDGSGIHGRQGQVHVGGRGQGYIVGKDQGYKGGRDQGCHESEVSGIGTSTERTAPVGWWPLNTLVRLVILDRIYNAVMGPPSGQWLLHDWSTFISKTL